jgi:Na+-driven multidrug efflux pump
MHARLLKGLATRSSCSLRGIAGTGDLGLGGIWVGLTLFIAIRLVAQLGRMRSGRWVVVGAVR